MNNGQPPSKHSNDLTAHNSLDAYDGAVAAGDVETDVETLKSVPMQFAVTDERSANWLVKRIVAARNYAARVKAWADQELARATREEHTLMFLYGPQIVEWSRNEVMRLEGRRKSIALPGGTVGFRSINSAIHIDDEASVLLWAKSECPSVVVTVEKLSRSALNAYFETTGELPPKGARVAPGFEKFYIR